jgi:hypothetical protein
VPTKSHWPHSTQVDVFSSSKDKEEEVNKQACQLAESFVYISRLGHHAWCFRIMNNDISTDYTLFLSIVERRSKRKHLLFPFGTNILAFYISFYTVRELFSFSQRNSSRAADILPILHQHFGNTLQCVSPNFRIFMLNHMHDQIFRP